MTEITVVNSRTVTNVVIDPPVTLTDKTVSMGDTDIRAQYAITRAIVESYSDEEGKPSVTLRGFRLTKRGKVRENAREEFVPTCYVTTRYPDGTITFASDDTDALVESVLEVVNKK